MGKYEKSIVDFCNKNLLGSFVLYGEVFGGNYKHENVEPVKNASKVQKGVYYCPQNEFLAFDIKINGEYMGVLEFTEICNLLSIPYIPMKIIKGSIYQVMDEVKPEVESNSTIHTLYGLPPIENNIQEGVVIKPLNSIILHNGSRCIVKFKNDKFKEVSKEPKEVTAIVLEGDVKNCFDGLQEYITENRLENVISHFGEVSIKDFGAIMQAFTSDIFDDFSKENNSLNLLETSNRKQLNKLLNKNISLLVRKRLLRGGN